MKVQSPIAGAMAGSAGNLTFQHYHGQTYGRSKPVLFHYGPTPAQAVAQNKFYGIRAQWNPLYREIKPFVPDYQLKQANAFNTLTEGVYKALGTFSEDDPSTLPRKFGFDLYERLSLRLGNYTLYYDGQYYYITLWDFDFTTDVEFVPQYAHALYLCPDLQQIGYDVVNFNAEHLTFVFTNSGDWFPDHYFNMYVALSDEQFFSNFFF